MAATAKTATRSVTAARLPRVLSKDEAARELTRKVADRYHGLHVGVAAPVGIQQAKAAGQTKLGASSS